MRALIVVCLLLGVALMYFGLDLKDPFLTKLGNFVVLGMLMVAVAYRVKSDLKRLSK